MRLQYLEEGRALETICSAMEGHSEKMTTCKHKNQEEALDQHWTHCQILDFYLPNWKKYISIAWATESTVSQNSKPPWPRQYLTSQEKIPIEEKAIGRSHETKLP